MSEDRSKGAKETIAEEVKVLAGKVYDDAAKPAITQIGSTAGLAIEVLLAPINIILGSAKAAVGRLSAAIQRKLSGIPPERLLAAPPTIAAPVALHYALLGDQDDVSVLREMFENLLVASMDRETTKDAHPAFVSMISQLTQDEAWILKSINRTMYEYVELWRHAEKHREKRSQLRTMLGVGIGINEDQLRAPERSSRSSFWPPPSKARRDEPLRGHFAR